MKKFMLLVTILITFSLVGCSAQVDVSPQQSNSQLDSTQKQVSYNISTNKYLSDVSINEIEKFLKDKWGLQFTGFSKDSQKLTENGKSKTIYCYYGEVIDTQSDIVLDCKIYTFNDKEKIRWIEIYADGPLKVTKNYFKDVTSVIYKNNSVMNWINNNTGKKIKAGKPIIKKVDSKIFAIFGTEIKPNTKILKIMPN